MTTGDWYRSSKDERLTKHIYSALTIGITIYRLIIKQALTPGAIALLLIVITAIILKDRFFNGYAMLLVMSSILIASGFIITDFTVVTGIVVYYLMFDKVHYLAVAIAMILGLYHGVKSEALILFWILAGGYIGWLNAFYMEKEQRHISSLDQERRLRHELEYTKNRLLQSQDEIEFLTEVKERNRIAREIHDSVGHGIAGVLFHLQAAAKLLDKDQEKSRDMLTESIGKLSETLELTRDTVYNLESDVTIGINQIKDLLESYDYCPVNFNYSGNFNQLSPKYLMLLKNIIRESLTNASKHSHATQIDISLEMNDHFIRYAYSDNGTGGEVKRFGMGLRNMKEQIENVSGTIVVDGSDGFRITCNVPR